jgi:group I intron endonuclease
MFIYKWTNLINGKIYIGLTNNIKRRLSKYKNIKPTRPIEFALRKYYYNFNDVNDPKNQFKFEIIDKANNYDELNQKEIDYIEFYKMLGYELYNLKGGGRVGYHSEETRKKMSESHKGSTLSEEHRKNISKAGKGRIVSEETKKKLSESQKGNTNTKNRQYTPLSEEHKQKLSESHKGKKASEESKKKMSESAKGNTSHKGKVHSEETKKKLSEASKKYWEDRKNQSIT